MRDLADAKLFDDLLPMLDFFDKAGIRQVILSASERSMLLKQLEGLGIADRFEEIMGIDNIYGDSKLALAEDWRRRHPEARAIFIGDTTHDCKTAEILDAECFIVCAGHQCRERFEGISDKVYPSLSGLKEYLEKNL